MPGLASGARCRRRVVVPVGHPQRRPSSGPAPRAAAAAPARPRRSASLTAMLEPGLDGHFDVCERSDLAVQALGLRLQALGSVRCPKPDSLKPDSRFLYPCATPRSSPPSVRRRAVRPRFAICIAAGVDVFRLNFSHGTHADARRRRSIASAPRRPRRRDTVAILQDLSGPKIRTGALQDGQPLHAVAG